MIGEKGVVDWLDLQLGLGGVSILLLVSYLLFARHDKESKGAKIVNTMTLLAIVATVSCSNGCSPTTQIAVSKEIGYNGSL